MVTIKAKSDSSDSDSKSSKSSKSRGSSDVSGKDSGRGHFKEINPITIDTFESSQASGSGKPKKNLFKMDL